MWKRKLKKAEMNKVYIGIGSNVGNKLENIKRALNILNENEFIFNTKISSVYETIPYGTVDQDNFYNAVIFIETTLDLFPLLNFTKKIEKQIGRVKRINWGPREIDLDILLFNNVAYSNEQITIPHKDLHNRDFVLVPLLELNDKLIDPNSKKMFSEYLSELKDKYIISKFKFNNSEKSESIK